VNRNNNAGLPYSDELYHYGIVGQKWGVRRFQNADRTWTAAGKERYGSGKAKEVGEKVANEAKKIAKAVGNASKRATKYAVKRFKMKHPSLMSDEELIELKKRLDLERTVKDARRELKKNSLGHKFIESVGDITKRAATDFATNAARNISNNIFSESKMDKEAKEKAFNAKNDLAETYSKIAENNEKKSRNESKIQSNTDRIDKLRSDRAIATPDKQKTINKKIDALEKRNKKLEKSNTKLANDTAAREQTIERKKETANTYYNYRWQSKKDNNK